VVLHPLRVVIAHGSEPALSATLEVPDYPFDATRGSHHVSNVESVIYIDRDDFRLEDDADFFGRCFLLY